MDLYSPAQAVPFNSGMSTVDRDCPHCFASPHSNVGYQLPLKLGRGWLSASGSLTAKSADALELVSCKSPGSRHDVGCSMQV